MEVFNTNKVFNDFRVNFKARLAVIPPNPDKETGDPEVTGFVCKLTPFRVCLEKSE